MINTKSIASNPTPSIGRGVAFVLRTILALGALFVIGILVWQGFAAHGAPDPTASGTNPTVAVFDIGVLVFREGLECILVLSAITASMVGENAYQRKPAAVVVGGGISAPFAAW